MRRTGTAVLCATLLGALCAAEAPTATAALPTVYKCVRREFPKWRYANAKCTREQEKLEGFYEKEELKAGEHIKFDIRSGTSVFKTPNFRMTCTSDVGEEVTRGGKEEPETNGPEKSREIIKYSGCSTLGGLVTCSSSGMGAGEVSTEPLEGYLYYIKEPSPTEPTIVGTFFVAESGTVFAKYSCGGTAVEVLSVEKNKLPGSGGKGSCLTGEVAQFPNGMFESFPLSFTETSTGEQLYKRVKYGGVTFTCELEVKVATNLETGVYISRETIEEIASPGFVLEIRA